jgi:hypothetical protein
MPAPIMVVAVFDTDNGRPFQNRRLSGRALPCIRRAGGVKTAPEAGMVRWVAGNQFFAMDHARIHSIPSGKLISAMLPTRA